MLASLLCWPHFVSTWLLFEPVTQSHWIAHSCKEYPFSIPFYLVSQLSGYPEYVLISLLIYSDWAPLCVPEMRDMFDNESCRDSVIWMLNADALRMVCDTLPTHSECDRLITQHSLIDHRAHHWIWHWRIQGFRDGQRPVIVDGHKLSTWVFSTLKNSWWSNRLFITND